MAIQTSCHSRPSSYVRNLSFPHSPLAFSKKTFYAQELDSGKVLDFGVFMSRQQQRGHAALLPHSTLSL
ncbi:hypothetical protein PGT21_011577 [Puccinia graminis f. sp. tritici]|uniref:Uncharacterized protein n=1 Tax=Puccinia graminis f. sp. tritici TaxID=56615 RepID=A0A5B0LX32_PUCGR|nr:hypothetical protein PGT21_011577 [Puccinia graminis f. sp. tritici]KAA1068144.1 hypothetical protein PGTUg99_021272 [Puccinia graminis f. sp. tritici]